MPRDIGSWNSVGLLVKSTRCVIDSRTACDHRRQGVRHGSLCRLCASCFPSLTKAPPWFPITQTLMGRVHVSTGSVDFVTRLPSLTNNDRANVDAQEVSMEIPRLSTPRDAEREEMQSHPRVWICGATRLSNKVAVPSGRRRVNGAPMPIGVA